MMKRLRSGHREAVKAHYNLRELASEYGTTLTDVARITRVPYATLKRVADGSGDLQLDQGARIAKFFDLPLDKIF